MSAVDVLNELRKFERTYMAAGLAEEAAAMAGIFAAVNALTADGLRKQGYVDAFYEMCKLLDIPAMAMSPKQAWETVIRPKIEFLTAALRQQTLARCRLGGLPALPEAAFSFTDYGTTKAIDGDTADQMRAYAHQHREQAPQPAVDVEQQAAVDELIEATGVLSGAIMFRIDDPRMKLLSRVVKALARVGGQP